MRQTMFLFIILQINLIFCMTNIEEDIICTLYENGVDFQSITNIAFFNLHSKEQVEVVAAECDEYEFLTAPTVTATTTTTTSTTTTTTTIKTTKAPLSSPAKVPAPQPTTASQPQPAPQPTTETPPATSRRRRRRKRNRRWKRKVGL